MRISESKKRKRSKFKKYQLAYDDAQTDFKKHPLAHDDVQTDFKKQSFISILAKSGVL